MSVLALHRKLWTLFLVSALVIHLLELSCYRNLRPLHEKERSRPIIGITVSEWKFCHFVLSSSGEIAIQRFNKFEVLHCSLEAIYTYCICILMNSLPWPYFVLSYDMSNFRRERKYDVSFVKLYLVYDSNVCMYMEK